MSKFFEAVNKMDPKLADPSLPVALSPVTNSSEVSRWEATARAIEAKPAFPLPSEAPPVVGAPTTEPHKHSDSTEGFPSLQGLRDVRINLAAGSPALPFDGSDERAAERYRIIRTKLRQDLRRPRVLCISSSGIGDGKSVTATNIAGALALKRDTRVLLIDADLRRSTLAKMLGLPQGPGLSEVLAGVVEWQQAATRILDAPNLFFLPAGESKAHPAELLDSPRWKATCDLFRNTFSFVIVDSPPMGTVADYDLIQAPCDGIILVARQDHSNRSRLLKSIASVSTERLIGVVMNCVSPWTLWRTSGDPKADPYGYKPAPE